MDFQSPFFFPDNDPDGFRTVGKPGWAGKGFVCPRSLFPEKKKDPEYKKPGFDSPGVYILIGSSESTGSTIAYIGQATQIGNRINQHYSDEKKEFWQSAIFFTSTDTNLNNAHIQYLESRLISLAAEAKICQLENGTSPPLPPLSKSDIAYAESFLNEMLLCLPVLGVRIFEKPEEKREGRKVKMLYINAKGIKATGYEAEEGFVVLKGSQAHLDETKDIGKAKLDRENLISQEVLKKEGNAYIFTQDCTLSSPSNASRVVLGGSTSGALYWRDENGITLGELRERASKS